MTHTIQYMNGKEDSYISHLYYETNERVLRKQDIQKGHYVGIDEVGCGSIAGSLCVAAVVLPTNHTITELPIDSKLLNETDVDRLATEIRKQALLIEMVYASPEGVSKKGVEKSRHLATKKVVQLIRKQFDNLPIQIDGEKKIKDVLYMQAIVQGDGKVTNISAAAILAKSWSNHQMRVASQLYPGYGFEKHKGYPTNEHKIQLAKRGLCEFHRESIAGRMAKKTVKKETAFFPMDTLKEFLAVSSVLVTKNPKTANAWEAQFLTEQVKALQSGRQLSGPVQFHIEKVYRSIVKRSQGHAVDVNQAVCLTFKTAPAPCSVSLRELYRMFSQVVEVLEAERSRFSDTDVSLLRSLVKKLKKGEGITHQEYLQFETCYNNVTNRQLVTV